MDKETLSNYGWIVILVLILAVMLALATPFGTFIAGAIKSTTAGLFDVNQAALGSAGINVDDLVFENCDHLETEVRNVTDTYTGDTCCKACGAVLQTGQTVRPKVPEGATYTAADGTVYNPGDEMPETPTAGDVYCYGDYEYCYGFARCGLDDIWSYECCYTTIDGWGVRCINNTASPNPMLKTICGIPIVNLDFTYAMCSKLVNVPELPNTVTSMDRTFASCTSLTKAPAVPESVQYMQAIFASCTALTDISDFKIPENTTMPTMIFFRCTALTDLSDYVLPNHITSIQEMFYECKNLTKPPVISENSKIGIMDEAFYGCSALTETPNFPEKLLSMDSAFYNCTALTKVDVIPERVTYVRKAFYNCNALTVITIDATPSFNKQCFSNVDMSKITLAGKCENKSTLASTGLNSSQVTIID